MNKQRTTSLDKSFSHHQTKSTYHCSTENTFMTNNILVLGKTKTPSLEMGPEPEKEISEGILDERPFPYTSQDINDTLIERRRGTSLYLTSSVSPPTISNTMSILSPSLSSVSSGSTLIVDQKQVITPQPQQKKQQQQQQQENTNDTHSKYSILAQIECQNALLEKDPKSICIQSNELRAHYSTVQQLVTDYHPLSSPSFGNSNDNDLQDGVKEQQLQVMDWAFWHALIQDPLHVAKKTPHLLSIKVRAGIPSHVRGLVWQATCQSASLHLETVYGQLCRDRSPHERIIQRDLSRTFPTIDMFKQENGPGQLAMRRILVAYSLYDAHVGYCQGLAFLVGPLLINMPEPQAFCVFVRMMETFEMRSMFTLNMDGLQLRLYQFSCLLEEYLPRLAAHLNKRSIHAAMYASQWFLTLFAYAFPMTLVTRIYDILFVEGANETMMRISIALLQRSEHHILAEVEFEDLLDFVATRKLCAPYADDWSELIQDAMSLSHIITRDKLDQLEKQYAQQGKHAKKKTEQVLASRLGGFWRRKSTRMATTKKSKSTLERSISDSGATKSNDTNNGSKRRTKKNSRDTPIRNSLQSMDAHYINTFAKTPSPTITNSDVAANQDQNEIMEELLQALNQLRKEHSRTIDELLETKMDKKDVESERDALKMTIMELERRYHGSASTLLPSNELINNSNNPPTSSTHEIANCLHGTCVKSPSLLTSSSLSSLASSDDLLHNCVTVSQHENYSGNGNKGAATLFSSNSSSRSISISSSESDRIGDIFSDTTATASDTIPDNDGNDDALRTEFVRVKVDYFESQQLCERLTQEVDELQSRLDLVNEGQLALVDKLVLMKLEMDDLLLEKKRQDEKWSDLVEENTRLNMMLHEKECSTSQKEHETASTAFLMERIDELEASLAATKVRLAELESATDQHEHHCGPDQHQYDSHHHIPHSYHHKQQQQQQQQKKRLKHIDQHHVAKSQTSHDDVINAKQDKSQRNRAQQDDIDEDDQDYTNHQGNDNCGIGRSVSLYGRMWHVLSQRSQGAKAGSVT